MTICPQHRELYHKRRAAVLDAISGVRGGEDGERANAVAVFPSTPVYRRNGDVEHEYRQDSDLHYLTGFDEPQSVLVLVGAERKAVLFVRPRDAEREIWDGARAGVDGAKALFGADEAYPIHELAERLPKLFQNARRLYYRIGRDRAFDERVLDAIDRTRARARHGIEWPVEIVDPSTVVHEMRLLKGPEDLEAMRKAAAITRDAHVRAMQETRPGRYEYEIEALLLETFRKNGSERPAYGSIVGSGPNATVLHYRANDRRMEPGDLLLIDAGCEYAYYASDVTRTFPVSGKFSREQRLIYELVLEAQLEGIQRTRPGATLDGIHARTVEILTRGLVRLGLLSGEPEKLIEDEAYKPFYMHRTSHWLGMDVHDAGAYYPGGSPRVLAPGMVLTIEPGIYIASNNESVPSAWRGIGVRIEDDILVTAGDPENLTAGIPKSVEEVERACA